MDDPDLLYEDLFENLEDGRAIIKTSLHEMEDRIKDLSDQNGQLKSQVHNLQEQNEELSKQNEILIRNISCLFKTAQMEISRKDKQIRSLQQESLNASVSGCRSLTPAVESSSVGKQHPDTDSMAFSHGVRKHGESAVMVSKAESKSKERESSLPVSGVWKQPRQQAGVKHQDCVEMMRANAKGSDYQADMEKKRKSYQDRRQGHDDQRRWNERYLAGARAGEGACKSSFSVHRASESNRDKRLRS